MEIYRVCQQYNRGIQKIKIDKVNPDNTFIYKKVTDRCYITKKINNIENKKDNESCFFLTYEEAKNYLIKLANADIDRAKKIIEKAENTIKQL
jgi:hypothetical protein